jgi:ferredoxin-NADP reductase
MTTMLNAVVHTLRPEAEDVLGIELRPATDALFPAFEAGAHVDLHLGNGLVRSYSLVNPHYERHRYVIAVLKDKASRGGSRYVHEQVRAGDTLRLSPPRNHFPLHEGAAHSVLIAGGIGITPILCMARRLRDLGRSFEVLYFARSARSAAFTAELAALGAPVHRHHDDEQGGPPPLQRLLHERGGTPDTHYYACGPSPMLDAFLSACDSMGYVHTHVERFTGARFDALEVARTQYAVELRRSRRVIRVTAEKSLLQTLLDEGIDVQHSCQQGICGACETRVLDGVPDHRDMLLSPEEQAAGRSMLLCVSGSKSACLVLDL